MFNWCLLGSVISNVSVRLRTFHSFPERLNKYGVREARIMRKLMNNSSSKRKSWYTNDNINNRTSMPTTSSIHQKDHNNRRVSVLNKLFMRHITDLMATGEVASKILHHGIEISRVKVAPDFTRVNVFWLAKGSKHNEETEIILKKCAGKLQFELAQLRLIGTVPAIMFVKDKSYSKLADVDRLLAVADFGEDYTPVDQSRHLKSEFVLNTHFSPGLKGELELSYGPSHLDEEPLPLMRMDVLGINQSDIMNKVKKSLKKSQALHRARPDGEPEQATSTASWIIQSEEAKQVDGHIREFLVKQQRLKRKVQRGFKNYQPEYELYENEWQTHLADGFLNEIDEDDHEEIIEPDEKIHL